MTEEQQNDYFEIIKRFAYEDEYDDSMDFEGQLQVNKGKKTNKNQSWNNVSYKDGKKVGDTDTSEASDMEEPDQSREPNAFQKKGEPRMPGANYSTQRDDRRGRGGVGGGRGGGRGGRGAQQNKREYLQSQRGKARPEGGDGGYEQKRGGGGNNGGGRGGIVHPSGDGDGGSKEFCREENMYARERANEGGALDRDGAYTKKNTNRARGGGRGGGRGGRGTGGGGGRGKGGD
jgi:hypothetical protein